MKKVKNSQSSRFSHWRRATIRNYHSSTI